MALPDLKTLASVVALSAAAFGTPALAQDAPELTQPENWSLEQSDSVSVVTAPEGNLDIAVIEVGPAEDALAAANAAWALYDADAGREVELTTNAAPDNGWRGEQEKSWRWKCCGGQAARHSRGAGHCDNSLHRRRNVLLDACRHRR